jgi:hypothetical protein
VVGASSAGTNRVTLKSSMSATRIFPGRFVDFRGDASRILCQPVELFFARSGGVFNCKKATYLSGLQNSAFLVFGKNFLNFFYPTPPAGRPGFDSRFLFPHSKLGALLIIFISIDAE